MYKYQADAIGAFGSPKKKNGEEWTYHCPSGLHEDNNPSFSVNVEKGTYYCFACAFKGTLKIPNQIDTVNTFDDVYVETQTPIKVFVDLADLRHVKGVVKYDPNVLSHPYLVKKEVNFKNDKILITQRQIIYESLVISPNSLLIFSDDGFCCQQITFDCKKLFLKGSRPTNTFISLNGVPKATKYTVLCEGMATGLSIALSGYNTKVCWNGENVKNIIEVSAKENLIVCCENDHVGDLLQNYCKLRGIKTLTFDKSEDKGFDANDYHLKYGLESLTNKIYNLKKFVKKPVKKGKATLTLDTRPTGVGKTVDIFKKIKEDVDNGLNVIVVTASTNQANTYESELDTLGITYKTLSKDGFDAIKNIGTMGGQVFLIMFNYFSIWLDMEQERLPAFKGQRPNHYNQNLLETLINDIDNISFYFDEFHSVATSIFSVEKRIDYFNRGTGAVFYTDDRKYKNWKNVAKNPFQTDLNTWGNVPLEENLEAQSRNFFTFTGKKSTATFPENSCCLNDFGECEINHVCPKKRINAEIRYDFHLLNIDLDDKNNKLFGDTAYFFRVKRYPKEIKKEKREYRIDDIDFKDAEDKGKIKGITGSAKILLKNQIMVDLLKRCPKIHIATATADPSLDNLILDFAEGKTLETVGMSKDNKERMEYLFSQIQIFTTSTDQEEPSKSNISFGKMAQRIIEDTNSKILCVEGSKQAHEDKQDKGVGWEKTIKESQITVLSNDRARYSAYLPNHNERFINSYLSNPNLTGSNMFFGVDVLIFTLSKRFIFHPERWDYFICEEFFNNPDFQNVWVTSLLTQVMGRIVRQPPPPYQTRGKIVIINKLHNTKNFLLKMKNEFGIITQLYDESKIIKILNENEDKFFPLLELDKFVEKENIERLQNV